MEGVGREIDVRYRLLKQTNFRYELKRKKTRNLTLFRTFFGFWGGWMGKDDAPATEEKKTRKRAIRKKASDA